MCWGCVHDYLDKPIINDRIKETAQYVMSCGHDVDESMELHVIISDMNVHDGMFDLSNPRVKARYDALDDWERTIYDMLSSLSEEERIMVAAIEWGMIDENGKGWKDINGFETDVNE